MSEANQDTEQGKGAPLRGVLPAGTTLRGYELVSILGQGAFGITYRARDLTLGRDVAIKEYLPATLALREGRTTVLPRSPDHAEQFAWGRERFLDEARTLARLDRTSAIVRVYDFLEANGTAYMVMALIEGETLNKRLTRELRLTPSALTRIAFPLLDGLEEVHAIGFLHRDIKPANVMMDSQGRPTLIDFGASRAAMAERSTTLTAIFTPGYAAAEQFASAKLGPWSDIYGLAATLYHCITGNIPPPAFERVLDDAYQSLADLKPEGYDPVLLAGIDAGLAIRAADRPQSIAEWRAMLRNEETPHLQATRVGRKPGRLASAVRKTGKARITIGGPALWGSVAAAVVVLVGAGYLANSPSRGGATLNLSTEQLEQVLAERRKADALVAEKRRLEEEARQKAEADAEAKRQADAQLEQTRQALQRAEQQLAALRTDIEARRQPASGPGDQVASTQRAEEDAAQRKAEAEAAALREAEEAATKKAEVEAEAKRQADQALAVAEAQRKQAEADARAKAELEESARRQASEDAQRKAEAEAATRRQADEAQVRAQAEREKAEAEAKIRAEADKAAAELARLKLESEAAERGLRLEQPDRQRLQVALTSLGFDTRGSDGMLGPRSREMIAAWQKARNQPSTGFLTATQRDQLLRAAAPAVARWDDEQKQKKVDEEKRKADTASTVPALPSSAPAGSAAAPSDAARAAPPPEITRQAAAAPRQTSISVAPNPDNISSCRFEGVAARVYPDKIEMRMSWGWEAFKIDPDGSFSGRIEGVPTFAAGNTYTRPKFSIQGNVRSKQVRFESLTYYGCTWTGTIN